MAKSKISKESVFKEVRKAGKKGKRLSAKSKIPFLEQLENERKIKKIGSKYYATEIFPRPEEIYEDVERAAENGTVLLPLDVHVAQHLIREGKIKKSGKRYYHWRLVSPGISKESVFKEVRKAGKNGKKLSEKSKLPFLEQLENERKIKKIGSKYYATEIFPRPEEIYEEAKRAAENGTVLLPLDVHVAQHLIGEGKIKKSGRKYYYWRFAPLTQKDVITRLLDDGILKRSGRRYIVVTKPVERPLPRPSEVPSFSEFAETLQNIYLRKARGYRQGVNILSLIEALTSEMDISEALAKKWILELPRTFVGVVDLRPFPGEPGLKLEDGTEVSRIYLERGIVGL